MRVAFNKIKITPKDYIGMPMAGYARKHPCLGKLDDIYANGVLITNEKKDNQKASVLLISLDLLKIPLGLSEYIKKLIKREHKLEPDQILIHCTHTHSAPDLTGEFHWPGGLFQVIKGIMFGMNRNDSYIVWFTLRIIKMVDELFKSLKPCKLAWSKKNFNPDIVINRRHPKQSTIPELGVISFIDLDENELIGFILNYSCHPTTLSFMNKKLSADYPGKIIERIAHLTKNKVRVVFFNGMAGDLNPITTCGTNYKELEDDKSKIYNQLGTYTDTQRIGYIIAEEALKLVKSIPNETYYSEIDFEYYLRFFWVPMKDIKYFSKAWFNNKLNYVLKKELLVRVAVITGKDANFPAFTLKRENLKIKAKTVIQFIKFRIKLKEKSNEFGIVAVPGELFEDIGKNFLKETPTSRENTFIFQNSNDWISYLFSPKDYIKEGGYEPVASFSPLCGYYIEKKMLNLFNEIKNK